MVSQPDSLTKILNTIKVAEAEGDLNRIGCGYADYPYPTGAAVCTPPGALPPDSPDSGRARHRSWYSGIPASADAAASDIGFGEDIYPQDPSLVRKAHGSDHSSASSSGSSVLIGADVVPLPASGHGRKLSSAAAAASGDAEEGPPARDVYEYITKSNRLPFRGVDQDRAKDRSAWRTNSSGQPTASAAGPWPGAIFAVVSCNKAYVSAFTCLM